VEAKLASASPAGAKTLLQRVTGAVKSLPGRVASENGTHATELAGLGTLAAMPIDKMQAEYRARKAGLSKHDWERKSLLGGETGHSIADVAGLGILAAPSLAHLRGKHASVFAELAKTGAMSEAEARRALDRLDTLDRNQATPEQGIRYGTLGAATGIGLGMLSNKIKGKSLIDAVDKGSVVSKLRAVAADGTRGAVAGGALPFMRQHLDRGAEVTKLRRYVSEQGLGKEE
jgi:hypothetical protein